jgi:hypothetical protein
MKVETDNIASIEAGPIGQAVIVVIMFLKTFKTKIVVFYCYGHNLFNIKLTEPHQKCNG